MARRNKKCPDCNKMILEYSNKCGSCTQKGKVAWNKGRKRDWYSPTQWQKGEPRISGEVNYLWKGDKVSYTGLHIWVARWKGKPQKCERCGFNQPKRKGYDWANISGEYKRDLDDYIRLCKSCHRKFDMNGGIPAWL